MRSRLDRRKGGLIAAAAVLVAALAALAVAVGGDGDEPSEPVAGEVVEREPPEPRRDEPERHDHDHADGDRADREGREDDPFEEQPSRLDQSELSGDERAAARTVRAYVDGFNEGDGEAVCNLLVAGAIDEVDLPRRRGGCGPSLSASIGYRDPRGLPVWRSARVEGLLTVEVEGDTASVTATTVTRFADRDEPSVEDDVVHLVRDGDGWRIAKASSTLYRAVGISEVPPRVLAPPR